MKGTKLYSILFNKCPHCHEGDFFITNTSFSLKNFNKQHTQCSVCKEDFEKETGFYYGAMYVSYGLGVALGVGMFLVCHFLFHLNVIYIPFIYVGTLFLLSTWIYRKSRLIWINLFVKYKS